jgi:hypothetical protein
MHAVFTPEHAICEGGHFYAASTMQDTMFAIVHTFIKNYLTNADKPNNGILLRRIVWFYYRSLVQNRRSSSSSFLDSARYDGSNLSTFPTEHDQGHLPVLTDFNSVLDLFTLCNLIILSNVLDLRTYQISPETSPTSSLKYSRKLKDLHDVNAIAATERYQMAHSRGCCFDILHWYFKKYEIFDKETLEPVDGFNVVAMEYLRHQASVILVYKKKALAEEGEDSTDSQFCTAEDLESQMNLCLGGYAEVPAIEVLDPSNSKDLNLAFPDRRRYGSRPLERCLVFERKHLPQMRVTSLMDLLSASESLLDRGTTRADRRLFNYLEKCAAQMGIGFGS